MKYYLTTPLYYTNGTPHIGHTYSTIVADLIRRFKRMQGYEAILTTGTDEHGVNVERSAKIAGKTPKEFVGPGRSEEHTSELQSQSNLVCRLLLEKKNTRYIRSH